MLKRLAVLFALSLGVVCLVLPEHQSPDLRPHQQASAIQTHHATSEDEAGRTGNIRVQRQTVPPRRRLGVFQALFQLVFGTARDVRRAFVNITNMIQTNLIPTLQFEDPPPTPATTPAAPNASTTEPPYRLTRQEALDIIRRNLYGLVRLFNREYRLAINDSRRNAARGDEDLRNALRPYFT